MIDALDYLTIAGTADVYQTLLGRRVIDGRLRTRNIALTFDAGNEPLCAIVFATADLDKAARLLARRAVECKRVGGRLILSAQAAHGVPVALGLVTSTALSPAIDADETSAVSALDHVVIRSPNPQPAIAFYAGRLRPGPRLHRTNPAPGSPPLCLRS